MIELLAIYCAIIVKHLYSVETVLSLAFILITVEI